MFAQSSSCRDRSVVEEPEVNTVNQVGEGCFLNNLGRVRLRNSTDSKLCNILLASKWEHKLFASGPDLLKICVYKKTCTLDGPYKADVLTVCTKDCVG